MRIAVVDYGAGNLTSVRKALRAIGAEEWSPQAPADLDRAEGVIVPGVGHFARLGALGDEWRNALGGLVRAGRPVLGICLGMQWLFEGSEEAPDVPGLGVIAGVCGRLEERDGDGAGRLKVPHVGWNQLELGGPSRLLEGVSDGAFVYFTHSYAAPLTPETAAATAYGCRFASAVERGNVLGVQFHPEKSGEVGLRVLRNFLSIVAGPGARPSTSCTC